MFIELFDDNEPRNYYCHELDIALQGRWILVATRASSDDTEKSRKFKLNRRH